ncbi:hypothetical protein GCM10027074_71510 [Streptomyces deserti]
MVGGLAAAGALLAVQGHTGAHATARTARSAEAAGRTGTAGTVSFPPEKAQALHTAISDLSHPPAVCAQLHVVRDGARWYGTAGTADLATGRAVRADDRIRAGSITKVFVATVVLQLWAQGRVGLTDPIGRHLPGLLPSAFARITPAQLLNHTSGLPDHRGLPDLSTPEAVLRHRFDRWTPREWARTVTHDPLKFAPGTRQEYRGINYVLLALLVEKLTGRAYGEAIVSRILRPLGLRRTLLPGGDPRLHGSHVHGYLRMTDGSLRDVTVHEQTSSWGEGELVSTVDDLVRFQQALFSGALLPPQAMDRLFELPPDGVRTPTMVTMVCLRMFSPSTRASASVVAVTRRAGASGTSGR